MLYSVRYKLPGQWFFRTIKNVKGDGIMPEARNRWLILSDETRIEIPCSAVFKFSVERFMLIQSNMEKEAGQKIPIG